MTLLLEMDELSKETPIMRFDLKIPLETRMWALKKYDSFQHGNIQDSCEHENFKNGICGACDFACEHWEIDDNICFMCEKFVEPSR